MGAKSPEHKQNSHDKPQLANAVNNVESLGGGSADLPMRPIVFIFFFLSGFSALVFEQVWLRELALILGNTAQATATVLAVFLGGLAAGSYFAGKQIKSKETNSLKFYGLLEISVALFAFTASSALGLATETYVWLVRHLNFGIAGIEAIRLLISVAILLIPSLLMGASLPVMLCYLEKHSLSTKLFSYLYGVNTLGAATGSAYACFIGFTYLGVKETLLSASAINLAIGGMSMYLSTQEKSRLETTEETANQPDHVLRAEPSELAVSSNSSAKNSQSFSLYKLGCIAFLSGYTALSFELLWTSILRCYVASLTYAFTLMICLFLLGLAFGSFLHKQKVLRKGHLQECPFLDFALMQYCAAAFCALSLAIFPHFAAFLLFQLKTVLLPVLTFLSNKALLYLSYLILLALPTIFLPAIFIGFLFPMLGTLAAGFKNGMAPEAVGKVYAFNTLGCLSGSLCCGFVLIPSIGSVQAYQWTVFVGVLIGAFCIVLSEKPSHRMRMILIGLPLCISTFFLSQNFQSLPDCAPGSVILASGEDDTVGKMRIIGYPKVDGVALELNGLSMANTFLGGRRYMRLLAGLPLLLHKKPEKILLGCFGTGTTAGVIPLYHKVKNVELVEISQMVINAAKWFEKTNYGVLNNPKVTVRINDVRNFLLTTEQKYDVITFEPPPPAFAGTVNLYTTEFYALTQKHLNEDGLLCQWVPLNQVSKKIWKMMLMSARKVYPYICLWCPNNREIIFVASKRAIGIDSLEMQRKMETAPTVFRNAMAEVGLPNSSAILSSYLCDEHELDKYIEGSLEISDNNPRLEFFLPYTGATASELELESPSEIARLSSSAKIQNISEDQKLNELAIHLLRKLNNSSQLTQEEAGMLIEEAFRLVPENQWLKYIKAHPQAAYPRSSPTLMD
ncbi:MAG: fused MFS/spermidine synthase [Candidatus Obscuribacterales bacterium]|nr:fused MFS/spermidine synthase [Candidatus Obscuribacterales bacterium]